MHQFEQSMQQELSLLRALALTIAVNEERMLSFNCYPKDVRDAFKLLLDFYEQERLARAV